MVIEKGQPWGSAVERGGDLPTAATDAALARLVAEGGPGRYGVTGGDVYTTLGRPSPTTTRALCLPMDLLRVVTDRGAWGAVAHVVVHRRFWRGRIVAAVNVGRLGRWDVAPSAHPNDGRFEAVEVEAGMAWRDRLAARRRLATGTHVPHPAIRIRHVTAVTWELDGAVRCVVDGVDRGTITTLSVSIEPDAFELVI